MNKAISSAAFAAAFMLLLGGCQNGVNNPELNQCAQQNFQCENSCNNSSINDSMTNQVCVAQCQEVYNRCKEQAEKLGDVK
ncbi:hypothetical protein [Pseudoalteromonas sp. T1lg75]|uniref:hypothetical protein n=1 Tax=Pseudoalteromonas sp. T1lg75 TaxID=2077102 RepID=UPI000CF69B28|nr:hypothetical protein [Pseudoalteromonas sp. T1lg75]